MDFQYCCHFLSSSNSNSGIKTGERRKYGEKKKQPVTICSLALVKLKSAGRTDAKSYTALPFREEYTD